MGKRSAFPRRARDFYPTPRSPVLPLVPHLPAVARWAEPCAGDGALVFALADFWPGGVCVRQADIEPQAPDVMCADALSGWAADAPAFDLIVTNPPWPRPGSAGEPTLAMARHFAALAPTWLLLPFALAANQYFADFPPCQSIVPVGRPSWMGNGTGGVDDAAWFRFDAAGPRAPVVQARPGPVTWAEVV